MHVIEARNVEDALYQGLEYLGQHGRRRESRNGPVLVAEGPVTTVYEYPRERVLFWPARNANPFFHLYESLWMLGGCRDVGRVAYYVRRMNQFSDDGMTLHGAYGHRWLHHFGVDQLTQIASALRINADDRRQVLAMWDPRVDLGRQGRDLPCNLTVTFQRNWTGELDMSVFCRSNDIIWGAYGANAVHFSVLQEYMAARIGCEVGRYWQVSVNYHAYVDIFEKLVSAMREPYAHHAYEQDHVSIFPLVSAEPLVWDHDLRHFLQDESAPREDFHDPFFRDVAVPMRDAHSNHRRRNPSAALRSAGNVAADDWRRAAVEWLERRA